MEKPKVKLNFMCSSDDGTFIKIDTQNNQIRLQVIDSNLNDTECVFLTIPTAIKLHKTLRSEIAKIKEGGQNG